MSNDRFSRVRAFAGPNALEPSRSPEPIPYSPTAVSGVLEGLRVVTGYVPKLTNITDPSQGFTSIYDSGSNIYTVTLVPPFSDLLYTLNVTPNTSDPLYTSSVLVQSTGDFNVYFSTLPGNLVPIDFFFTAIGN